MLVLERRRGEAVLVGDDIKVTILDVDGGGVRIGVEAPRDLTISRSEQEPIRTGDDED